MKKLYLVLILAFIVRILWLNDNLFFGYEQGRDFIKLAEISRGDLVLVGPKTDIDGLFHGAFSYYSLLPSYLIFGGNPYLVLVSLILIHVLSVVFMYKFAKSFKGKKFAIITTFVYAVSYSSAIYARWLSNPNLVPAFVIFILYFLQKAKKNKNYLIPVAFFWALIVHLQIVAALILILPIVYFVIANKAVDTRSAVLSLLATIGVLASYAVFNFRHENILIDSFMNYLSSGSNGAARLDELYNDIVDNFFAPERKIAFLLFWAILIPNLLAAKKEFASRFLILLYFSAPLLFMVLRVSPLRHLLMLNSVVVPMLVANSAVILLSKKMHLFAFGFPAVIVLASAYTIITRFPNSDRNFLYHAQRTYLDDMKKAIDYVYGEAERELFSYDYFTVPYWQPEAWEYLFLWYGVSKYGYMPVAERTEMFYVLIEPDETQPKFQEDWYRELSERSILLGEYYSGKLKAEKRKVQ